MNEQKRKIESPGEGRRIDRANRLKKPSHKRTETSQSSETEAETESQRKHTTTNN